MMLHPLSDFLPSDEIMDGSNDVTYWYEGRCPQGVLLQLPRTRLAEALARGLMRRLAQTSFVEGKMIGVLLVESNGERRVLKAFSGLLHGQSQIEGWVTPIAGRDRVALQEAQTLAQLEVLKAELLSLQTMPERSLLTTRTQEFAAALQQLAIDHAQQKQIRQQQRLQLLETLTGEALTVALGVLDDQSRRSGSERRRLKQQRDRKLQPLQQVVDRADARIRELKQHRRQLSQQLQAQMHAAYRLTNFAGESQPLQQLMSALPTGAGDCCAPKLLHYAATHGLKPLAMAEFWWGTSSRDRTAGQFYEACPERCQPLMGYMLSGLSATSTSSALPVLYQDEWLIAVDKPAGLLSVPGRYGDRQDSVQSRLQQDGATIVAVHRLDQDTSGVLLLARDGQIERHLRQQFQQRQVGKVYEALLAGKVEMETGTIELPLWGDPSDRPRQKIDWQWGKLGVTKFRVLVRGEDTTRIELLPLTGRTHQLRVHAADATGLGIPILGDRLYGCRASVSRLHLHAREITFQHPHTQEFIQLKAPLPF